MADNKHSAIFAIINQGFADEVMVAAKAAGARGGTILSGRGTASKQAETIFDIMVHPEKEIVLIVVDTLIRDKVLHEIYRELGFKSDAQCITFSLPVDEVVGIIESNNLNIDDKEDTKTKKNKKIK